MAKRKTWSVVAWLLLILLPMVWYMVTAVPSVLKISLDTSTVFGFVAGLGQLAAGLTGLVCALTAVMRPWRLGNRKTERVWATLLAVAVALRLLCELLQINTSAGGVSLYVPLSVDVVMHVMTLLLLLVRRMNKTVKWVLVLLCTAYTAWLMLGGLPEALTAFSFTVPALRYLLNLLLAAYMRTAMVFFALAPQMKKDV
jgi:hypothetical protein